MAYNELQDAGKGVDKPKGLVKQAIWGLSFAVLGLCGFIVKLLHSMDKKDTQCSITIRQITEQAGEDKLKMQQDYNQKLETRLNRLENVEERADKVLPKPKNEK